MIMMNGDSPVPGSSPPLPMSAALPTSTASLDAAQFPNGPPPCAGCGQPIRDEFILRVQGHLWHAQCLRCAACQTSLAHTCYVRGSRVFCRMDFFRLFGASCSGCGEVIPPSEVVRTAHDNIYHLKCFVCVVCTSPLNTGDQFYLRHDGKLLCERDFHHVQEQAVSPPDTPDGSRQEVSHTQQQQHTRSNLHSLAFTPQETEILQEVYRACPNPSHDTMQRISSQHGLDVTRVRLWFHVHRKARGVGEEGMEKAVAPPGGYPLPIVNEVSSTTSGRLPSSSRSDVMSDMPFPVTSSCSGTPSPWPLSDDVWLSDFVPPNIDLNPCDIKNGEVCNSRRGLPPSPMTPDCATRGQCFFMGSSGKGNNCQQEQLSLAQSDISLPWINS